MDLITNPAQFASYFNLHVPGARRLIDTEDVRLLTECELICRYGFYSRDDLHTIRNILRYENLRRNRDIQLTRHSAEGIPLCKRCAQRLPVKTASGNGRPREFCDKCQPYRNKDRYTIYQQRKKSKLANRK